MPKDCADFAVEAENRLKATGLTRYIVSIENKKNPTGDIRYDTHNIVVIDMTGQIVNLKGWEITKIIKKDAG
jgi:hypothetical protein